MSLGETLEVFFGGALEDEFLLIVYLIVITCEFSMNSCGGTVAANSTGC